MAPSWLPRCPVLGAELPLLSGGRAIESLLDERDRPREVRLINELGARPKVTRYKPVYSRPGPDREAVETLFGTAWERADGRGRPPQPWRDLELAVLRSVIGAPAASAAALIESYVGRPLVWTESPGSAPRCETLEDWERRGHAAGVEAGLLPFCAFPEATRLPSSWWTESAYRDAFESWARG